MMLSASRRRGAAAATALCLGLATGTAARAQQTAPAPPAPAPPAPAPPKPTGPIVDPIAFPIRTADTLRVVVANNEQLTGEFRVDADGTITMPRLGQIKVVGAMQNKAADSIRQAILKAELLRRPEVAVYISARTQAAVIVSGAVATQGRQAIKDDSRLSEIIEAAGIVEGKTDLSKVVITRGTREINIDYAKFRSGRDSTQNPLLQDNDRIYVAIDPGQAATGTARVSGEVRKGEQTQVVLNEGTTVGQILQQSGGLTDYADRNGIYVERDGQRVPVPYDEIFKGIPGKDIVLKGGDIVMVPRLDKPKQVFIEGAVNRPGAIPLLTKTTLLEAIGQAGGTQDGARENAVEIRRAGASGTFVTTNYDLRKGTDASVELADGDSIKVPFPRRRPGLDLPSVIGVASGLAIIFGQLRR